MAFRPTFSDARAEVRHTGSLTAWAIILIVPSINALAPRRTASRGIAVCASDIDPSINQGITSENKRFFNTQPAAGQNQETPLPGSPQVYHITAELFGSHKCYSRLPLLLMPNPNAPMIAARDVRPEGSGTYSSDAMVLIPRF